MSKGLKKALHIIGGNLVTWRDKMQIVVDRSSVEGEFKCHKKFDDLLWFNILLLKLRLKESEPMKPIL